MSHPGGYSTPGPRGASPSIAARPRAHPPSRSTPPRPSDHGRLGGVNLEGSGVLNRRGFEIVNLGTGMRDIHTTKEWVRVSDMAAAAEVTLSALTLAGEGS